MENIDKYKLKITNQTIELEGGLNRNLRTYVLAEYEIYEEGEQDNQDGTYNKIYKAKLVGSSEIKQQGEKPSIIKGKTKRSQSQRLRAALWAINPEEEFYENTMNYIINNIDDIIEKNI